ncbi:MAG: YkoF family thiamine/hydroxymethylpyrimidine-binding protein [Halanaerobiaceae bacterium]
MEEAREVISCQIIFYPLETADIKEPVKEVLDIIKSVNLEEINIGSTATTLKGDREKIYNLLNKISATMDKKDMKYALSLNISNSCGC